MFSINRNWTKFGFLSRGKRVYATAEKLKLITAANIKPREILWLWPHRIPLGKLTLFVGDPDNGKSMVAIDVAARVTTGSNWHDSNNNCGPCDVLFFAGEDDYEDTAVPRLVAAGADRRRVHFGEMQEGKDDKANMNRTMSLGTDIEAIEATLKENPNIRCVFIDPVSNHLGNVKMVD